MPGAVNNFKTLPSNRMARAFWTLNDEMVPAHKVTFIREIDASSLDRIRDQIFLEHGMKPSYTALVIKAATIALKDFPYANRAIIGYSIFKKLIQFNDINITVAIERDVPDAEAIVLADTINETSHKSLVELTAELKSFAQSTLETNKRWLLFYTLLNRLPVCISKWIIRMPRFSAKMWSQHRGGACFVNSPAKYGVDCFVADMLWPLTVTFGWVKERPWVVNGEVVARKTMPLTIIFDRRIMAGVPAAKFFNRLAEILEHADFEQKQTL